MQSNTNGLSISITLFFFDKNIHSHHTHTAAAMHLIIHNRGKVTRIKKPLVMERLYKQLGRGHVHITFVK